MAGTLTLSINIGVKRIKLNTISTIHVGFVISGSARRNIVCGLIFVTFAAKMATLEMANYTFSSKGTKKTANEVGISKIN